MTATFLTAVSKFTQWLQSVETHPSISSCFTATLSSHQALLFCPSADPMTLPAAQEQDLIGWDNFLLGQVSLRWSPIQEEYLKSHNSRRRVKTWETALVCQLLSISHAMWTCHNGILHHHTESAARLQEAAALQTQIQAQFDLGLQHLLLSDQSLLTHLSLAQILHQPIPSQQQWLAAVKFARTHGQQQQASELEQMRTNLAAYVIRYPPPP